MGSACTGKFEVVAGGVSAGVRGQGGGEGQKRWSEYQDSGAAGRGKDGGKMHVPAQCFVV